MRPPHNCKWIGLSLAFLLWARPGETATSTLSVRLDASEGADATLREDLPDLNSGSSPTLTVVETKRPDRQNAILTFPLPDMTGWTVLEARLRLYQSGADRTKPVTLTVHPLTESWSEGDVTWNDRTTGVPWATPGGTKEARWSDRLQLSNLTVGSTITWQVGPILAAGYPGLLLEGGDVPAGRGVHFPSREYGDTTRTPLLEVLVTDEPPAIASATAEFLPNSVGELSANSLTLLLDVDPVTPTGSGLPTGMDRVLVRHGGTISPTGISVVEVNGTPVPTAGVSWTDDGGTFAITLPAPVVTHAQVRITFSADVLVGAGVGEIHLPVLLDDATTSVPPQATWPGDVDGIPGNGDDWILAVIPANPSLRVREVTGPSSVAAGDTGDTLRVRVENLHTAPVLMNTVDPFFTDLFPGDANGDFLLEPDPANPETLLVGASAWFSFTMSVNPNAVPRSLVVDAFASASDINTGLTLSDGGADAPLSLTVTNGGLFLSADQQGRSVLPGSSSLLLLTLRMQSAYPFPISLNGLTLENATQGPGTQAELDAELGLLTLYLDDGDGVLDATRDARLDGTTAVAGTITFGAGTTIPSSGDATLFLAADVPLDVRDGDVLDVRIPGPSSLSWNSSVAYQNAWPIDPVFDFPIDGMAAAQIVLHPVEARTLTVGAVRQLVLDVELPPNGYEADQLRRFNVVNLGTAAAGTDIDRMELWADAGTAGFDPAQDRRLGQLTFTGERWEITGLHEPVPLAGLRVYCSVDVSPLTTRVSSIRLELPSGDDTAVGMQSGNSGPRDEDVANAEPLTITTQDRVVLAADQIPDGVVRPGQEAVLLHLRVTNTYTTQRTLDGLRFRNASSGTGTGADLDGEIALLTLHADGDGDQSYDPAMDPVLGRSAFFSGKASFSQLGLVLEPGEAADLFLAGEVSPSGAADGDELGAEVVAGLDVTFLEPTAVAAEWPVSSGGRWTVDGMVAAQLTARGEGVSTLGPGDGPTLALDLVVPANGYRDDLLQGVRVANLGTAAPGDLSELRLWRDGGDDAFDAGTGDDVDLGELLAGTNGWQSSILSSPLNGNGARFYVSLTVSPLFSDSADVVLAVPVGGITVASGNDGPLDVAVTSPARFLLSDAPLLASLQVQPARSTVGSTLTARMIVRNASTEGIHGIRPSALAMSGTAGVALQSGPAPDSLDLAAGETDTLTWTYLATGEGELVLSGDAAGTGNTSGQIRRALLAQSGLFRIFTQAQEVRVSPANSMPFSVSIGQDDVIPLSITLTNPSGSSGSSVELESMRIRLEDGNGAGLVPSSLLDRVVVSEGQVVYAEKTALETGGADVRLDFGPPNPPAGIAAGESVTFALRLDVSPSTTARTFRVVLQDATFLAGRDATSGAPIGVTLEAGTFPFRTATATLVGAATGVLADAAGAPDLRVGPGQTGVLAHEFTLLNQGTPGITAATRLGSFACEVVDTTGAAVAAPDSFLAGIRVVSGTSTLAVLPVVSSPFPVELDAPLLLPVGTAVPIRLEADLTPGASPGAFRLRLADPASFEVRDINTGNLVPVSFTSIPLNGPSIRVERPASQVEVSGTPRLPASLIVGQKDVEALGITVHHPGAPETERVELAMIRVSVRDDRGTLLAPGSVLDGLALTWNGQPVGGPVSLPGSPAPVALPLTGILLEPGASGQAEIAIDVDAAAAAGRIQLVVDGTDLAVMGANQGQAVPVVPAAGSSFPLVSGLAELLPPARKLVVGLASAMPPTLDPGASETLAGRLTLGNPAALGSGSVLVGSLLIRGADASVSSRRVGTFASRVRFRRGGQVVGTSGVLGADSTTARVEFDPPLTLDPETSLTLDMSFEPATGTVAGGFRLGLDAGDVGVLQPGGVLLGISVVPVPGQSFPLWTESGSVAETSLEGSYANFPNPFAAGIEPTSFVYYLPDPGRVTLRIWTARGEKVVTLLDGVSRPAGLQDTDRWDGRNGGGSYVLNGVYVAELVVHFDDGSSRRLLRKVAVVR